MSNQSKGRSQELVWGLRQGSGGMMGAGWREGWPGGAQVGRIGSYWSVATIGIVSGTQMPKAIAHNIQTEGNVGVLFHIEPNHNPKAGEPSQAWFALRKKGGASIAIDQCNCQLTVFSGQQVVAQPALQGIAIEQYVQAPAATIVFPKAGVYQLQLQGSPKGNADFNAFQVSYEVVVQPGTQTASPTVSPTPGGSAMGSNAVATSNSQPAPIGSPLGGSGSIDPGWILGSSIVALMMGLGIGWTIRNRRK